MAEAGIDKALLERAYPISIQAAKWCFARFPQLQARFLEPEDLAHEWLLRKAKHLGAIDEWYEGTFRFQVFNGVRWVALQYIINSNRGRFQSRFVSLDATVGEDTRFIDLVADDSAEAPEVRFDHDSAMEELLSKLEDFEFSGGGVANTPIGSMKKNLRSVAELLLAGFGKKDVADFFDITKAYVTKLTRCKMVEVLGLEITR